MAHNKRKLKKANHGRRPCMGRARREKKNIKTPR
jgi:hypothetical protein